MRACGIDPPARTAFEARIRQLQRLGVPKRADDRTLGRLEYGVVELAALATAVQFMAAFMVPSLAARYVNERWTTLAPAVLAGARASLPPDYVARRPLGDETIILIEASALSELGRQGRHDERYGGRLGEMVVVGAAALADALQNAGAAGLILDTTGYMPRIVEGFAQEAMASEQELAHELNGLRFPG